MNKYLRGWTTHCHWLVNSSNFVCKIQVPDTLLIPKKRYWAYYNDETDQLIISGRENKIDTKHIDVHVEESAKEGALLRSR
jgi:hypothetical protein